MSAHEPVLDPRRRYCEHCKEEIGCDPAHFIFVVDNTLPRIAVPPEHAEEAAQMLNESTIAVPFTARIQPEGFLVADDELVFDRMVCFKKWLLDWVNNAVLAFRKAGRA